MPTTRPDCRPPARDDVRREATDLDRNYGRIGISAVAAAARYCSGAENQAAASEKQKSRKREHEAA